MEEKLEISSYIFEESGLVHVLTGIFSVAAISLKSKVHVSPLKDIQNDTRKYIAICM